MYPRLVFDNVAVVLFVYKNPTILRHVDFFSQIQRPFQITAPKRVLLELRLRRRQRWHPVVGTGARSVLVFAMVVDFAR